MSMYRLSPAIPSLHRNLLFAGLTAFALVAAMPAWQIVYAQAPARAPISNAAASHRHVDGLALERRGDEKGAFIAFLEAAEGGYPPAQRRLGEIYDSGNSAVERNYEESIRWYEKAREGGEQIPPPKSPMPTINPRP
jgi:TPR repeat protein